MTATLPAPCDRASAAVRHGGKAPHQQWTLVATILASSLAFIDGSVVNVALPAIGHGYGATAADLQWTINAYLLPLSALLLIGGAAGDHFGRRRLLIGGIAIFTLASVACAMAPSLAILLPARALQGIGAAMLMPNSLAILGSAFSGEEKGRAIGAWAAVGAIANAVGPPLGGWLVEVVGWRAIFFLNVPVAAAAMLIAWRYVAESAEGEQPLDWVGAALATPALGLLTWALTLWSSHYLMTPAVSVGLVAGLISAGLFVLVEHRRGELAMMPLGLFSSIAFVGLTALTFLLYAALGGLVVLLPYVLIEAGGYPPLKAGMALLPFPLIIGSASPMMGRIAERTGPRWPLTVGPLVTAAGFALLMRIEPQASYWTSILPAILVIALGMAGAVAPLTTAVLSSVDGRHTGTAAGFNSAIARIGGLLATALAGAVIAQSGMALVSAFHDAALIGAALAFASGAVAFATLQRP
jgi:EmrB/QacA subfamily drug resistance transporter